MINDLIFTVGSLVFFIALLPSIFSDNKPDKKTSITTAAILYLFCLNYLWLDLYFSAVVGFITASGWLTLYIQVKRKKKINASGFST